MKMKQAIIYVEACRECPFFDNEGGLCTNLEKPVIPDEIDEECPLEDM